MNIKSVIAKLKEKYPNKNIIANGEGEVVCEIKSTTEDVNESIAIAVIEETKPHYHNKIIETYEVLSGKLILNVDGVINELTTGEKMTIKPRQVHFAIGNETWIKCTSIPGWTFEDHIII